MNKLHLMVLAAGICFGTWPFFLMRSGLKGNVASLTYGLGGAILMVVVVLTPLMIKGTVSESYSSFRWLPFLGAILIGMPGLIFFNTMMVQAGEKDAGRLFVVVIVVQTCIPAIYHVYNNGEVTLQKIVGFAAAIVAAVLLLKK